VTCTTRLPRPGEIDGEDYHFFSPEQFERELAADAFLEHAIVHGFRYGILKREIQGKLTDGSSVILNIDVQGAATIRAKAEAEPLLRGGVVSVFVMPPSLEVLRERML